MKIKIGVLAGKGGVGKTTVSHLLALGFARADFDTALLVTDPEREVELFPSDTRPYVVTDARTQGKFAESIAFANEFEGNLAVIIDGAGNKTGYYKAIVENTDLIVIPFTSGYVDMMKAKDDINELREAGALRIRLIRSRWSPPELENDETVRLMNQTFGDDIKYLLDYSVTETSSKDKPLRRLTLPNLKFQHTATNLDEDLVTGAESALKDIDSNKVGFISGFITHSSDLLVKCLIESFEKPKQ